MRRIVFALGLVVSVLLATPAATAIGGTRQCDFDNDGYDDAAIGVAGEDAAAGAVNVIYGSADKLTSIGDQLWTQDSPGLEDTAEANDQFGFSVECGDFNGDNYADLVIASPWEDIGGINDAGAVHLLFGSVDGLTATDGLFLHRNVPGVAGQAAAFDHWGQSLAAGDFNNDGRDDLAVGAPFDDVNTTSGAGSVQVFFGSAGGLSTSGDKIYHRATPGIKGPLSDGNFGSSLAAGDFNGDDHDDLAIGSPSDTINAMVGAGAVNVIYGSNGGLTKAGDDLFHRATPGIRGTPGTFDLFGHSLAAGDFDNNGYDELAIGAPFDAIGAASDAGSVQVLQGGANGLKKAGDKIWHRNRAGIRGVAGPNDGFGYSLTAARFNSGGHYDLAVGVWLDDVGAVFGVGSVHVIYGSGSGLVAAGDQIWHQGSNGIKGANESNDNFGWSVGAGDFDGNGKHDLLIGVPNEDGPTTTDSGKVSVIYGKSAELNAAGDQQFSQDSAGILGTSEDFDNFGRNVNGSGN
ncbi:MAG: hypothetical protein GY720_18325 [bacterium]|nr:hypothetical protein [bacterium]